MEDANWATARPDWPFSRLRSRTATPMSTGMRIPTTWVSYLRRSCRLASVASVQMKLTHILVISDLQRSLAWYRDVLGATLTGEYGGTSAVFNYDGAWLLIVTPGGETHDKPGTEFVPPPNPSKISH